MDSEQLSSISGYLSIVCWVVVFLPQLWKNYQRKSGDGLSMTFLVIWLVGDVLSELGIIFQDLLPTMFYLSLWYTVADMGLIWQVIYYQRMSNLQYSDEEDLLIAGQRRRRSSESFTAKVTWYFNVLAGLSIAVVGLGSVAWYFGIHGQNIRHPKLSQVSGWGSAILYVGSRIPQIVKNYQNQSTEGLSLAMFVCALFGNLFFTSSIFLRSTDWDYIVVNLSWIVGSMGTVVLDLTIFTQFFLYRDALPKRKDPDFIE
ncbi:PQ-loop-domain-containing protein [Hesseltinella vesiculosa]|uniref:PQ-loop-domain-containing protein n=1 Tax=Hesseltinella vesiculosa TaxID=101127 RepID=A0A1X2G3N1_9FUNG|nr:PQ-loop-domain-containing protein [Hesseltinella vesiculosa]